MRARAFRAPRHHHPQDEEGAARLQSEVQAFQEECERDLLAAEPIIAEAEKALDSLDKKELTELKSFGSPAAEIVQVVASCLVLTCGGKVPKDRDWNAGKKMMADVNGFLNSLRNFDKDNVPVVCVEVCEKDYLGLPGFNAENIGKKSAAAAGLVKWVINICRYFRIYQVRGRWWGFVRGAPGGPCVRGAVWLRGRRRGGRACSSAIAAGQVCWQWHGHACREGRRRRIVRMEGGRASAAGQARMPHQPPRRPAARTTNDDMAPSHPCPPPPSPPSPPTQVVAPKRAALGEANRKLEGANKKLTGIRAEVKRLQVGGRARPGAAWHDAQRPAWQHTRVHTRLPGAGQAAGRAPPPRLAHNVCKRRLVARPARLLGTPPSFPPLPCPALPVPPQPSHRCTLCPADF